MEDYYELLEIDPSWSADEIDERLLSLNRTYRTRTNHRDGRVREEALEQIGLINRAMARIGPDSDRNAYDRELAAYKAEEALFQPMSDVDLYAMLEIDPGLAGEQIEELLDAKESDLASAAATNSDVVIRQQEFIMLARRVLLDPDKRAKYDEQLAQRASYAAARDAAKPVPLRINGATVIAWQELEAVLDTHPDEGLALLHDGELEAWVRWSLGEKSLANHVRRIAQRSLRSKTPFMEQQELLRLINAQRPLVLYAPGKGPGDEDCVTVHAVTEIPRLIDQHWARFVEQADYVLDWVAQYGAPHLADQLGAYAESDDVEIWLERLVATIAPDYPAPELELQGIANHRIDFGEVNAWSKPTQSFAIRRQGRGYLYGRLHASVPWLTVTPSTFAGQTTQIVVEADRGKMESGAANQAAIVIEPLDGRVESVEIEVSVRQKTLWKSVTGLFGGKG